MPRISRNQVAKIQTAFALVAPMSEMLALTQKVLEAHHPEGVLAEDCPICIRHQDAMLAVISRWQDAQARAAEHWNFDGEG